MFALAPFASAQIDVVTERYDNSRTGANLQETVLDTTNVNSTSFGKLWSYTVAGSVYAQPLYVRNVSIGGTTYNVLYIVTMNDVVYAFDADSSNDVPLLSFDLTTQVPGSTPVDVDDIVGPINDNIIGNVGIESTPYIDVATNTMYLVARTRENDSACDAVANRNPTFCQRLHALDITTLAEKAGSPVLIGGSVPGNGTGNTAGTLIFDPKIEDQRSSLAMSGGHIVIAWSSHDDFFNYHGWVLAYDATTLAQTGAFVTTPNNGQGGIWMSGRAPIVDADGNVYYMTGNGNNVTPNGDGSPPNGYLAESFIKLGPTQDIPLVDWFMPHDWRNLDDADLDLGGGGPLLVPGTDLITGAGKGGTFYVTHTAPGAMGEFSPLDVNIVQSFPNGNGGQVKGGPVYWDRADGVGPWMYVWSDSQNKMNAYAFDGGMFNTTPVSQSTMTSRGGSAGGVLTLSANGSTPGTGIVWSSMAFSGSDPNSGVHPGVLRALDADNLSTELWNSEQNHTRDGMGNWPKFSPPTVVNGRVYMASFPLDGVSNAPLNVYGLITSDFGMSATPPNPGTNPGGSVTYTLSTTTTQGFTGNVALTVDGLPDGATASFANSTIAAGTSTTLTVQTSADTPLGESALTITGVSGSKTHAATVALLVSDTAPDATAIGIDFVGTDVAMDPTEYAGVLPRSNWNDASNATSPAAAIALIDELGTTSTATVSWSASSIYSLPIADAPGDARMMKGYLDTTTSAATTVTVTGLPAEQGGYFVYVYIDGDNQGATRTGIYEISGDGTSAVTNNVTDAGNSNFSGTYTQASNSAGNYAVFFVGGTDFTLTATPGPSSDGNQRAPINGIQIVHGDRIFGNGFE